MNEQKKLSIGRFGVAVPCLLQAKMSRKIGSLNLQIQRLQKHRIFIVKSKRLKMFQEIISVCCENHTKPT